jgi:hypothetical protein
VLFTDDRGAQFAMRRLRGRRILVSFWQSGQPVPPRIALAAKRARSTGRTVHLAVNGGGPLVLADVRHRNNLTFPLIHDPSQSIATLYA